jgi:hypothetical protein
MPATELPARTFRIPAVSDFWTIKPESATRPDYCMQSQLRSPQGILACVPSRYSVQVENVLILPEHRYRDQLSQPTLWRSVSNTTTG